MTTDAELERQISGVLVGSGSASGARREVDVTARVLADSSQGPGEGPRLISSARPAGAELPPSLSAELDRFRASLDNTMGSVSKPLAYARLFRYLPKREHGNLIRLIKGGHIRIYEVSGGPPAGSNARLDSPFGDRYYVLRAD